VNGERAGRHAEALIDLEALRHNLAQARRAAGEARVFAVVKADAYGHGLLDVARALHEHSDGFVVATLGEGEALRRAGVTRRIMVLQGHDSLGEARRAARLQLEPVLHTPPQLDVLDQGHAGLPMRVWLEIDSGMHRMGFDPAEVAPALSRLDGHRALREPPGLMTHMARADERDCPLTQAQLERFTQLTKGQAGERSLANSATLLGWPAALGDVVRPGIMLYGGNPFVDGRELPCTLKPVMQLRTRLLAVRWQKKGDRIGYGETWTCPEDMPVGLAAIGYGDGYPRHAPSGTPVRVAGQDASLVGRVSMDLLTLDLRGVAARPGDEVLLWGEGLSVDSVASMAGTISYELLCAAGARSRRVVLNNGAV
jgi:alanine racemase